MKTLNIDGLELTRLKHAGFKIKTENLVIYIDPYKVSDEPADLILITHKHYDHFDPESLEKLKKTETIILTPESIKSGVRGNVIGLSTNQTYENLGLKVIAVAAYNKNHAKDESLGFVLEVVGKRIYHAGDTDRIPEMKELGEIDIALVPIGGTYTMDEEEAAEAVKDIKPNITVPMHYHDDVISAGNANKFKELVGESSQVEVLE